MLPTSEPKTPGPSHEGNMSYSLPRITLMNLGEAAVMAPGGLSPSEKPKCSDLHQTWWEGRQGCGEVYPKDSRWMPPFPLLQGSL